MKCRLRFTTRLISPFIYPCLPSLLTHQVSIHHIWSHKASFKPGWSWGFHRHVHAVFLAMVVATVFFWGVFWRPGLRFNSRFREELLNANSITSVLLPAKVSRTIWLLLKERRGRRRKWVWMIFSWKAWQEKQIASYLKCVCRLRRHLISPRMLHLIEHFPYFLGICGREILARAKQVSKRYGCPGRSVQHMKCIVSICTQPEREKCFYSCYFCRVAKNKTKPQSKPPTPPTIKQLCLTRLIKKSICAEYSMYAFQIINKKKQRKMSK